MKPDLRFFLVLVALFGVLFGALVPVARAQTTVEVDEVFFTTSDQPGGLAGRGYIEVPIRVRNESSRARPIEIRAGASAGDRWTAAGGVVSATLQAGEEREVVLTIPSFVTQPDEWLQLNCIVDGNEDETLHNTISLDRWPQHSLLVAVYSDRALGAGWEQQREADLSNTMIGSVARSDEERQPFTEPNPRWYHDGVTWRRGGSMSAPAMERRRNLVLSTPTTTYAVIKRETDELPKSFVGLTSSDAVVLDGSGFEAEQLAEVARWVRMGGSVVVARDSQFTSLGELARARRPQNALVSFGEVEVAQLGLGTVIFAPGEPLETREQQLALWWVHQRSPAWIAPHQPMATVTNGPLRWRMGTVQLPGIGEISHRTILVLLIALAVVVGPINLWVVRRSQRPVAFLLTGPVLALVGTLVVVAYGTARDGIGIKDAARSWAVLDQETNTISSLTMRRIFVGLSDGSRLAPGPGTVVLPMAPSVYMGNDDRYWIERDDDTGETVHGGDFLAVRRSLLHAIHSDHSTRVRLVAEKRDGAIQVENALGATVSQLWLRDRDGRLWRSNGALDDGGAATLVGAGEESDEFRRFMRGLAPGSFLTLFEDLPPGSYAALLDEVVGEDDCNVRGQRLSAQQSLIGHLEEQAL